MVAGVVDWVCQHQHVTDPFRVVDVSLDAFFAPNPATENGVDRVEFYVSENGAAAVTHTVSTRSLRYPNHSAVPSPLPGVSVGTMAPFWGYGISLVAGTYAGGTIAVTATAFSRAGTATNAPRSIVIHNDTDETDRRPSTKTIYVDPVNGFDGNTGTSPAPGFAVRSLARAIERSRANPAGSSSADRDCGGATIYMMAGAHVWSSAGVSGFNWHTSGHWWLTIVSQPGATINRTDVTAGGQIGMPGNGAGTACRVRMISPTVIGLGGVWGNASTITCECWVDGLTHHSAYWSPAQRYSVRFNEDNGKAMKMANAGANVRMYATCSTWEGLTHGASEYYSIDDFVVRSFSGIAVESVQNGGAGGGHVRNGLFDGQRDHRDFTGRVRGSVSGCVISVPAPGQMRIDQTGPLTFVQAGNFEPMSLSTLAEVAGVAYFNVLVSGLAAGNNSGGLGFPVIAAGTNGSGFGYAIFANPSAVPGVAGPSSLVQTCYASSGVEDLAHPDGIYFQAGDTGQIVGAIYRDCAMRDTDNLQTYFTSGTTLNRCVFHNMRDGCNYEKQANWGGGGKPDCIITNNTIGGYWFWSTGSNVAGMNFINNVSENGNAMPTTGALISHNHTRFGPSTGTPASTGAWFLAPDDEVAPWDYEPLLANIGTASTAVDYLPDVWKWNPAAAHSRGCLRNVGRFDWSTNPSASATAPGITITVPQASASAGALAAAAGGVALSTFAAPTASAATDSTPPVDVTVADLSSINFAITAPLVVSALAGALVTAAAPAVCAIAVNVVDIDDGGGPTVKPHGLAAATLTVDIAIASPTATADVAAQAEATTTAVLAFVAPEATAATLGGGEVDAPSPAIRFAAPLATALVGEVDPEEPEVPQSIAPSGSNRRRRLWRAPPVAARPDRRML